MLMSKFYNNNKSSSNKNTNNKNSNNNNSKRNSISDPRIITPSSIPIFILPPTLDSYANGNKPDLNDSYDCWSVVDDENLNNIEYSHKRHSTASATDTKNVSGGGGGGGVGGKASNSRTTATSLENLNRLDIGPRGGGGGVGGTFRNSSISSTASTPNPQAYDYNQMNIELQKKQAQQQSQACSKSRVKTLFRNGFLNMQTVNNENDEIKSKQNYCNQWVLTNGTTTTGADAGALLTNTTNPTHNASSKSRSHNNLNNNNNNNNNGTNKSSSTNLSIVDPLMSKSPSVNFEKSGGGVGTAASNLMSMMSNDGADKSEEQMQREYLVNLLMQLQKEQDVDDEEEDDDGDESDNDGRKKKNEKGSGSSSKKKKKRSKSETLTTLNSIWNRTSSNISHQNPQLQQQQQQQSSNMNRSTSKRSNASNNRLNSIEKQNSTKSKTNRYLEVGNDYLDPSGGNSTEQRRFSLRALFSKPSGLFSAKSSQTHLNKRNSEPENYLVKLLQEDQSHMHQQNLIMSIMGGAQATTPTGPPKIVNSHCSMSNSSSMTSASQAGATPTHNAKSASFKGLPPVAVSSVTGSVLKFHGNKLNDKFTDAAGNNNETANKSSSSRTLSDPNMHKVMRNHEYSNSLRLPNENEFGANNSSSSSNRLGLLDSSTADRRELFQRGSKSSGSSNNLGDTSDDPDMDKIFSQYIEKRIYNNTDLMAGLNVNYYINSNNRQSDHDDEGVSGDNDESGRRKHRRFFSFMSRRSSNKKSDKSSRGEPNRSSLRSKLKLFTPNRSKSSSNKSRNRDQADEQFEVMSNPSNNTNSNKKASLNSNFKFDLNNLNLTELEKEFFTKTPNSNTTTTGGRPKRRGQGVKSDSIMSSQSIYLDANLIVPNNNNNNNGTAIKKSRSTLPDFRTDINNHNGTSNHNNNSSFLFKNNSKAVVTVFVDVCIEKLQQSLNGGGQMLSISLKNLRTEPLIEINHIKAKFNYLTIELVESKGSEPSLFNGSTNSNGRQNHHQQGQLLAKINKLRSKKCKFDSNLKSFARPIDFDLVDEHFLAVTEEATQMQIRKVSTLKQTGPQLTTDTSNGEPPNDTTTAGSRSKHQSFENPAPPPPPPPLLVDSKKTYLFLFSIELHSYLPVSRKILISTFRKKKRIFKGQCQIHENFINSTQFTKQFLLTEV